MGIRLNKIFNEDCRETFKRDIQYDYVITSPPDFDDLNYHPINEAKKYYKFLNEVLSELNPTNKSITIIVSNRKHQRKTIRKNVAIANLMIELGYSLLSEKIWIKTDKIDLYRYGFSYVMSFGKKGFKSKRSNGFMSDVWYHPLLLKGTNFFSKDMVKRCIENYTDVGDVVYDCFMGRGTTADACLDLDRKYIGSETNILLCELFDKQH